MKNLVGETISHYKILSEIGKGGMGVVYLAQDTKLNRKVAIKFLSEEFSKDSDKLKRFIQEAQSASALNHPNIITVFEIGKVDDANYIALEHIEGETLTDRLKDKLKINAALDIATQIASALNAAHSAGIVHRDIKPDNVMIRADGFVKILDFGIAKLLEKRRGNGETRGAGEEDKTLIAGSPDPAISAPPKTTPGMIIGTANYMSPEQAKGQEVDSRTDIFSFGVLLYVMIAGHLPFEGESPMEIISSILKDEPKMLPNVHPELEQIIDRALRKDRDERYGDTNELLDELQTLKKRVEFEAELERTSSTDSKVESKTQILKAATEPGRESRTTDGARNSIAVMPFEHLSADEDNEYFCDGLAEELINALAKIERLEVAARSSSFSFKGKNASASEISDTLNVKNILEGSVRKAGNRLRISVHLVNASDGYQIWSERYDRELKDIFDVQDEIAFAVVDALKVRLLGGEKEAVLKRYTSNAEAYQLYLQGRFFFSKRTPEGFKQAIDYYQRAIKVDSEFAIAYSGLSDCYGIHGFYELLTTEEAERLSVPMAKKAMELDDTIAEIWVSSGLSKFYVWDFSEGDAHYQKAISLNPKYASAYHFRSTSLMLMGRQQEAIESSKRAIELEPFAVSFNGVLAWWYYLSGRNAEAISHSLKTIEIAPSHFVAYWVLGIAYGKEGDFTKAITNLRKAVELSNNVPHVIAELGRIYAEAGKLDAAGKLLDELQQKSKNEYVSPVNFAKLYLGFGDKQKVLEYIEKASEQNSFRLPFLLIDPLLDSYRSDPLIQDVLRSMNMPTNESTNASDDIKSQADESSEASTVMLARQGAEVQTQDFPADPTAQKQKSYNNSKRDWRIAGVLSILIVVFGLAAYYFFNGNSKQIESIAVMPFVNESGNEDIEYLSDGMTETLIRSLSQIPNLNIKSRSTVYYYKGKNTSPLRIGEELNVQAVLLGRVGGRGEELKLNLELVNTQTQDVIWSEQYDRKRSDLVVLQKEIAKDVSTKLKSTLSGEDELKLTKTSTTNPEAYQAYLKGRFYWNKRIGNNLNKAIEQFNAAVDKDPNYALAYVGLGDCYVVLNGFTGAPLSETLPPAKAFAERAISLDNQLGEPHATLGGVHHHSWRWNEAEREFKRAIELSPNYATAYHWYSILLTDLGRIDEAALMIKRAHEIDPLSLTIILNLSRTYHIQGDPDAAAEYTRKVIELYPNTTAAYVGSGRLYAAQGRNSEAIASFEKAVELGNRRNPLSLAGLGGIYGTAGNRTKALAIAKELEEMYARKKANASLVAGLYSGLGDKDKAFEWLEKGFLAKERLGRIKWGDSFEPLRDDPRYKDLLKRMGLPE